MKTEKLRWALDIAAAEVCDGTVDEAIAELDVIKRVHAKARAVINELLSASLVGVKDGQLQYIAPPAFTKAIYAAAELAPQFDLAITERGIEFVSQKEECDHEWVDATNEVVESGEVCLKCHAVRAAGGG